MQGLAAGIRWAYFLSASLLVGVFACLALVARPAARAAGPETDAALAPLDRRLLALARWWLVVALAAALLDLWRQTAVATGLGFPGNLAPAALASVLAGTQYGAVWLARQGLLVLAGALLLLAGETGRAAAGPDWLALRVETGGLAALSLSLVGAAGHAASAQQVPLLAIAVDAVHLVATGVWFGALVPLFMLLGWSRTLPDAAAARVAATATGRFSVVGLTAVGLLVATGLFSAWEQVGSFPALFGTSYGQWLCLKIGLLLGLVAIAAANHLGLKPRLARAAAGGATGPARAAVRRLRRHVAAEVVLGTAVLGVVGILGLSTPARHDPVTWPFAFRMSWEVTRTLPGVQTRVAVGSQVALLGLLAALLAVMLRRGRWPWVLGAGCAAVGVGLAVALPPLAQVDAYPTTYLRPPVPYTAGSIADGGALYARNCTACHGPHGYGDGPAASRLRPRPADLTAKHTADHTAGDMYWWLTHGIRDSAMPAFGDRLSPEERWDLINFLRTLGTAERARALGPEAEGRPWFIAPDFSFTPGIGGSRSLKDYRGERPVVLVFFTLPGSGERLSRLNAVYPALVRAGADVLAVPLRAPRDVYRNLGERLLFYPVVVDGAAEAAAAYGMFRPDPESPLPSHLEFLIDRQGYVRARWAPGDEPGWADPARLVAQVERLVREPAVTAIPDEHVH
jgi:putative copper resistance protein D